ncbi:MAG: gliding motility-associated C-terminal domain-containing protein [Bacteroidia bacterium]
MRVIGNILKMIALGLCALCAWNSSAAQCGSFSFSVNDSNICLNQVVTFKAHNIPGLSDYTWFLGLDTINGEDLDTISTGYFQQGSFNVKLLIERRNGDTCSIVKTNFINVGKAPDIPVVTASKTNLCDINQSVKLSSSATEIAKWTWNVGQVLYKDSTNTITHRFIRAGFFDVGLTVEDGFGCKSTVLYDSMVLVERKPVVNLGVGDTSFCDTHTLFLNPTFNMFAQKGFKWDWTFSGANVIGSAKKEPGKLLFSQRGTHTFYLDALSPGNCRYSYNFEDTLRLGKSVDFSYKKTITAPCNSQTFNYTLSNPSQYTGNLIWKFNGDSVVYTGNNLGASATYKSKGDFKYTIEHNDLGCISEHSGINSVDLRSLRTQFSLDKNCSCSPNDTFNVTENSIGTNGTTLYNWIVTDSKDNTIISSNNREPSFILTNYDVYNVELKLRDTSGCTDSLYKFGVIRMEAPDLGLSVEPKVACVGSDILLGVDSICESGFISAEWKIFDQSNNLVSTSFDQFPVMDFASAGKYNIELIYETQKCTDTVYRKNAFEVVNLQSIDYVLSDTTPCEGAVINATLKVEPNSISPNVDWTITHASKPTTIFKASPVLGQENEYLIKPNSTGIYNMKIIVDGGKGCKDSVLVPSLVKVSGVKANFTANETVGCLPFRTLLKSSVSRNEHYDHPTDNSLSYQWQIVPSENAILSRSTASTTDIVITETGDYNVFLNITNSDGCSNGVLKEDLFQFDFNALYSIDTVTCQNLPIKPTNNTPGNNITFEWYTNTSEVDFYGNVTDREPEVSFKEPGTYILGLVATTKSGCSDTIVRTITVHPFSFDFSVLNNTPKCTPAQYVFDIKSNNVDTFTWLFGDGKRIVTDQKSIAHVYDLSTVKPFRNDFNVGLIAQNNVGCVDTIRYQDLIKVLGPNPTFKIGTTEGCNPLRVEFTDSSEQVERFYFNYGDGSSVDSISFEEHTYLKKDTNKLFEVFKPYVIASDKNNCFVFYQPDDSIVVYEKPRSRFFTRNRKVCAPYAFDFKNHSVFAKTSYWDYTNNSSIDDTLKNGRVTLNSGTYSVKLITENRVGCRDTLLKPRFVVLDEKPLALFNQSDTILCPGVDLTFEDQTNTSNPIRSWKWYFEGAGTKDSMGIQNPITSFADTGIYSITLISKDVNGCADTITKTNRIRIVNRLPIISPTLYYSTVENNNTVNLQWNQLLPIGFGELLIIKDGDEANPIKRITDYKTISASLLEPNVVNQPVQYHLKLIDRCFDPNRESVRHRTIHLTATRNEKPFAILTWTKYRGWPRVDDYVVYRSETGRDYKEIARKSNIDTSFTDFSVCDQSYFYLIGSVSPDDGSITYSNVVEYNPYYNAPKDTVFVELVTVKNDSIAVSWTNNDNLNVQNYFVDRYDEFGGWKKAYYETTDTVFIDKSVETHRLSYKYRVWYRDFCNNRNPPSNEGHSILLLGQVSNEDFIYNWNHYQEWQLGVKNYIVEKTFDLNKPFEEMAILDNQATTVIDNKKAIRSDSSFYVRVKAIEKGPRPDTSYSNIIKVYPEPVVHIPNAFTPNRDNVNDVLGFDGLGFQRDEFSDLTLRIYNRWGQRVFETDSYGDFWDGNFKGQECQEGVYTYYIQLRGINNTIYSYSGTVLLIR